MSLHIYNPSPTHYAAYVRRRGYKKWRPIGGLTKSRSRAVAAAVREIQTRGMDYKRARVVAIYEWCEPNIIMEITKP